MRDGIFKKALNIVAMRVPDGEEWRIMEVCGTHTMSIARMGIKNLLKGKIRMISGPGCPVCVTSDGDIAHVLSLSQIPNLIVATFGDMMRVPSRGKTLSDMKSKGADIRIVYSPEDALDIAFDNPQKEIAFIAVGFETTAPSIAGVLKIAKENELRNFSVFSLLKTIPNALKSICESDDLEIDGLILPGHVSAIIGSNSYRFIAERYSIPAVIAGFGDMDIIDCLLSLTEMIAQKKPSIKNSYSRAVSENGNISAQKIMSEVFEETGANWRGIGFLEKSGLALRSEYADFDAEKRFNIIDNSNEEKQIFEPTGCRCGDVIMGKIAPRECPLFGKKCAPENPVGPCMVSSEGACSAEYKYGNSI